MFFQPVYAELYEMTDTIELPKPITAVYGQRGGCLIPTHLTPQRTARPSISSFLLFPCRAHVSTLTCTSVTSKLLFGFDRLSGNGPFPPLWLSRSSNSGTRPTNGGRRVSWVFSRAKGNNYHIIESTTGRVCLSGFTKENSSLVVALRNSQRQCSIFCSLWRMVLKNSQRTTQATRETAARSTVLFNNVGQEQSFSGKQNWFCRLCNSGIQ